MIRWTKRGAALARWAKVLAVGGAAGCAVVPPDRIEPTGRGEVPLYRCHRASEPLTTDGKLEEWSWRNAPPTSDFVDIEGREVPPRLRTNVRMLWDEHSLYIGASLEEPHVWATLTRHDAVVYHDNDFEVFIDPDGDGRSYLEIEINALGTIFDLLLERTYREGGPAKHEWDVIGLKTAVSVCGTLNDPTDVDHGWTVEMAIPFAALAEHAGTPVPPNDGDVWRMNFSRVQWPHEVVDGRYRKDPGQPEENWVWSPQGEVDMHVPDRWGFVRFLTAPAVARIETGRSEAALQE